MRKWLNEPAEWTDDAASLTLVTEKATDFWRETFYGFTRDSGHACLEPVTGDFSASLTVQADYQALYDQAGIMLRVDETSWIKAGIEFTDGLMHFSTVVTRNVSDWSVIPLPEATPETPVSIRLTRHGDAVRVQFHLGDERWQMARLCPFPVADAMVGMTACTPERAGLNVRFSAFQIGPPISRQLHD
ncbi:DUF1349 domain-containing protein [Martelella soudanensis]|uniref:DUF1349 domain-containing protein n=1 Tax=unclassified Martelella TaxID=2629616 RepID=UPI0015DF6BD2|nr:MULTISPECIES: DUF1349 domain-containing protein [unclassified Martelella]